MQPHCLKLFLATTLTLSFAGTAALTQGVQPTDTLPRVQATGASSQTNEIAASRSLSIVIEVSGTYVITVPETSGYSLTIDGNRMVEANGAHLTAITSLARGVHTVQIDGADVSDDSFAAITIHQAGSFQEVSLRSLASSDDADDIAALTAAARVRANSEGENEGLRVATNIGNILAISQGITNPEPAPVNFGAGAVVSPLAPPANAVVTQAVAIVGGATDDGIVASTGQTLFGRVQDYLTYDIVNVTIAPSGRETTVSVGPNLGGFAVRLFAEDLATGTARVTVSAGSSEDETLATQPVSYDYTAAQLSDGLTMALSRATFGATPDLYARVRTIGYRAYLEEQFNPDRIDDSLFESLDAERFFINQNDERNIARANTHYALARAVYSEKQLQEVTGMFWSNHFHAITKMSRVVNQAVDDREYYRQNAFGNFEDMLLYSARSPLMSQFLDNDQSSVGNLNENYAREILELHTVGTDAGYGDEDIIAVARVFTGWNFDVTETNSQGRVTGHDFAFRIDEHDTEDKYIPFLDITIPGRAGAAGVEEGEELIAILAGLPQTHDFVCKKIVQWYVADEPPANFVDICTQAWVQSDGNSEAILRAILLSPEFVNTPEIVRTKGKNPFEYAAAFMRASGVELYEMAPPPGQPFGNDWGTWARYVTALHDVGYLPGLFDLPTGLDEVGTSWANSSVFTAMFNAPELTIANRRNNDILIEERMVENRLETAEELAAYLLAIATTDHYRQDEYEAMLTALEVNREPFRVGSVWSNAAISRGVAMTHIIPSFSLQ